MNDFNDGCPACGRKWVNYLNCKCGMELNYVNPYGYKLKVAKRIGNYYIVWSCPNTTEITKRHNYPRNPGVILEALIPFDVTEEQIKIYMAFS